MNNLSNSHEQLAWEIVMIEQLKVVKKKKSGGSFVLGAPSDL